MKKEILPVYISLIFIVIIVGYNIVVPYREHMGLAKRIDEYNVDTFFDCLVKKNSKVTFANDSLTFHIDMDFDYQPQNARFQILQDFNVVYDGKFQNTIRTCKYNKEYSTFDFNLYDSLSGEYYSWCKKESYNLTNKSNVYIKFDEMSDYLIKFYEYWFYF